MSISEINQNNIKWNKDGSAEVQTSSGITKIYKLQTAVGLKIQKYCDLIACDIWKFRHKDTSFLENDIYCPITFVVPQIITTGIPLVYKELRQIGIDFMENKLEDNSLLQMYDNSITNLQYMMLLGSARDYRSNCAICKTNNILEPIILRPCGHSICSTPCMQTLSKNEKINCPICEELVLKTFKTHDIIIPDSWKNEIECITKHFCLSKLTISEGKYVPSNIL